MVGRAPVGKAGPFAYGLAHANSGDGAAGVDNSDDLNTAAPRPQVQSPAASRVAPDALIGCSITSWCPI